MSKTIYQCDTERMPLVLVVYYNYSSSVLVKTRIKFKIFCTFQQLDCTHKQYNFNYILTQNSKYTLLIYIINSVVYLQEHYKSLR